MTDPKRNRLTDQAAKFKYVKAADTDVAATFRRIRREQAAKQSGASVHALEARRGR